MAKKTKTKAAQAAFKRGDMVTFKRYALDMKEGRWSYKDSDPCKVLGIIDSYAMLRYPRAVPFVKPVKELTAASALAQKEGK